MVTTHLETRAEGEYYVVIGFCGSHSNVQYACTSEVKTSTGQLPSGYYPSIFEKLAFAVVYLLLLPIWCFCMRAVLKGLPFRLITVVLVLCCVSCVLFSLSLVHVNVAGHVDSWVYLFLHVLIALLDGCCRGILCFLAFG